MAEARLAAFRPRVQHRFRDRGVYGPPVTVSRKTTEFSIRSPQAPYSIYLRGTIRQPWGKKVAIYVPIEPRPQIAADAGDNSLSRAHQRGRHKSKTRGHLLNCRRCGTKPYVVCLHVSVEAQGAEKHARLSARPCTTYLYIDTLPLFLRSAFCRERERERYIYMYICLYIEGTRQKVKYPKLLGKSETDS